MRLTIQHSKCLAGAFSQVLAGEQAEGAMAFARFFDPCVAKALARDQRFFVVRGWDIWLVTGRGDQANRAITAERALEIRGEKTGKTLLLIDTSRANPVVDEIANSSREIREEKILGVARRSAMECIKRPDRVKYVRVAIRAAQLPSAHVKNSPWTIFDYVCQVAADGRYPGEHIGLLGFWPAAEPACPQEPRAEIALSYRLVEKLLRAKASVPPETRIAELLLDPDDRQRKDLVDFIRRASASTLREALLELSELSCDSEPPKPMRHLWINNLRFLRRLRLVPWRTPTGRLVRWSGLSEGRVDPMPELHLPTLDGKRNALTVRWNGIPGYLEETRHFYLVRVLSEERIIAQKRVRHTGKPIQECKLHKSDFRSVPPPPPPLACAQVVLEKDPSIESDLSELFRVIIEKTDKPNGPRTKVRRVRTFSEALVSSDVQLADMPHFTEHQDHVRMRIGKTTFEVYRPPLVKKIENSWLAQGEELGRWAVKVESTGKMVGRPKFLPIAQSFDSPDYAQFRKISRALAGRLVRCFGGVGHIYHEGCRTNIVSDYVDAWTRLCRRGDPALALAHTVEIQSISGMTIGVVVLPSHPLRVAWHAAYDSLVFNTYLSQTRFPDKIVAGLADAEFETPVGPFGAKELGENIIREFSAFDGAMFPGFLPGPAPGQTLIHGEMHGFHTVCMVLADDPEPKATLSVLERALVGENEADTVLGDEGGGADVLAAEIENYMKVHEASGVLRVHAIRAGDGKTVARALGAVHGRDHAPLADEDSPVASDKGPFFVLELYPASGNLGISGRHIADSLERQRKGAKGVDIRDKWMREAVQLPQKTPRPRLRWARKDPSPGNPKVSAHVAMAFDIFETSVVPKDSGTGWSPRPPHVFGLLNFFESRYSAQPFPTWWRVVPHLGAGLRHPAGERHTKRLEEMSQMVHALATANTGQPGGTPVLISEINPSRMSDLEKLHRTCDWVLTLQQHGGIEYYDSPNDAKEAYDRYVISFVPEHRVDSGLQLITSTSSLEEVGSVLRKMLGNIGARPTNRNTDFILGNIKAFSGKSAIDLTGLVVPVPRTIALALCHAGCSRARYGDRCWFSLMNGFFVPYEDVKELFSGEMHDPAADPDIMHVSTTPSGGLAYRFAGIAYCGSIRGMRSSYQRKQKGIQEARNAWRQCHDHGVCHAFGAVRLARLARVLRFYADRAGRHHLPPDCHREIAEAIDRMVETNSSYPTGATCEGDRVWVLCPQHETGGPEPVSAADEEPKAFVFGVDLLPDLKGDTAIPDSSF